jgi:ribosomal protein S18 acetylase RimI-like enzyme
MELQTWSLDRAGELAELYNEQIECLLYRYPVTAEGFRKGIQEHRYARDGEGAFDWVREERLIVAVEDGQIQGFVDVGMRVPQKEEETDDQGVIRFLLYRPGCRPIGQALLEAAEDHCRSEGAAAVQAFTSACVYRFYYHEHGISDLLGHLRALLRMNGYGDLHGEIFLAWDNFSVKEPQPPSEGVEIVSEVWDGRGRLPGRKLRILKGGSEIGECVAHSVGQFQDAEEAQERFFVEWLGIEREVQGKGWGWFLLQRMLWEMHQAGYRHASISTSTTNHRGLLFYTNFGFRVVDTAYEFVKKLDE